MSESISEILPDVPQRLVSFFSEEEQNTYVSHLEQLAKGKPVGLDGVGRIEEMPPGQPVPGPEK